jgi:hypothetical protein
MLSCARAWWKLVETSRRDVRTRPRGVLPSYKTGAAESLARSLTRIASQSEAIGPVLIPSQS